MQFRPLFRCGVRTLLVLLAFLPRTILAQGASNLPLGPFIEDMSWALVPPPPPPPSLNAVPPKRTSTLREMHGQWRLIQVDDAAVHEAMRFDFTLWAPMFIAQRRCTQVTGQLIAQDEDGVMRIEGIATRAAPDCRLARASVGLPPFDQPVVRFTPRGQDLIANAGNRTWRFRRVITDTGQASDDFLRGRWLLASRDGVLFRGIAKTIFTIDDHGSRIDAANCDYWVNGAYAAENYRVRLVGSRTGTVTDCRATTLGDRWAKAPDRYELVARPVEALIELRQRGRHIATLVPAARFPELADTVASFTADPWSITLAELIDRLPDAQKPAVIGRVLSSGVVDQAASDSAFFSGYSNKVLGDLAKAGLGLAEFGTVGATVEAQALGAPIVVVAELEGTAAVDRGDGLSLDYLYRVKDSWRGDRQVGDVIIVRMPSLIGRSRSAFITPPVGARVLLLASRSGYLAGRLREGKPPSSDRRIVAMTLPVMRVEAERLTLDTPTPDIPGATAWRGLTIAEARERVKAVSVRAQAVATPRSDRISRTYVIAIDGKPQPDPTRLWFDFDDDAPVNNRNRLSGDITAWSDGCNTARRGGNWWTSTEGRCGQNATLALMRELIAQIEREGMPSYIILTSGSAGEAIGPYAIPHVETENHRFELRFGLR